MPTVRNRFLQIRLQILALTLLIGPVVLGSSGCRPSDPIAVVPVNGPIELLPQASVSFELSPVFKPTRRVNTVCLETAEPLQVTIPRQLDPNGNFTGFGSPEARDVGGKLVEIRILLRRTDGKDIELSNISEWGPSSVCYAASQPQRDEWYRMSRNRSAVSQVIVRSNVFLKVNRIYIESFDPWDRN